MSRRLRALDRVAVVLLGLALVALGLLVADWRWGGYLGLSGSVSVTPVRDVVDTAWWPWVFALAGVLVALVGLFWLVAHLRRPGPSAVRLSASDETGRLETDLRSLASAVAEQYSRLAPVTDVRGSTRTLGSDTVVELHARLDPTADAESLLGATRQISDEVAAAFPAEQVSCRVIVDAPRAARSGKAARGRVRVQ